MIWFFVFVILAFWLFPFAVLLALQFQTKSPPLENNPASLRFEARWKKPLVLTLTQNPRLAIVGFTKGRRFFVYVSPALWERLSPESQEATLMWLGFIDIYSTLIERLFWKSRVLSADRETALSIANGHVWAQTLQSLEAYNREQSGTSFWAGLGPLGPSLLSTYPSLESRFQSLSRYLAQTKAAR